MSIKRLRVTLIKSKHGRLNKHKECLHGLGLNKINHSVIVNNSPESIGIISKIIYMVKVEELDNVS